MAARIYPALTGTQEVVDLRRLTAGDLEPLLEEEVAAWDAELRWDFSKSAELVRRFLDLHALQGSALLEDGQVTGYAYYVVEESKALVGDLYVRKGWRTVARENALLSSVLDGVHSLPGIARIEAQLMMLLFDPGRNLPGIGRASAFERNFMHLDFSRASLDEARVLLPSYVENWSDFYHDAAAQVIAEAYHGHVDSLINDQYRSSFGARRFLQNIIQYPGCGSFFRPASFIAFEGVSGRVCGISLASMVGPQSGHVTQICVSPSVRKTGVGHNLLRRTLLALRNAGCRSASLTCTAANRSAVELYERVGFQTIKRFSAFVWDVI